MADRQGGMKDPKNRLPMHLVRQKGPIAQRPLLNLMKIVIDAAQAGSSTLTRDQARQTVRRLMAEANWNTPFILQNLWPKRCRYLSSLGYVIDSKYLAARPGDVERITAYMEGRRG